jgi:hypothetical protein
MANYWETMWGDYYKNYPSWGKAYASVPDPNYGEENPQDAYSLWKRYQRDSNPFQNFLSKQYNKYRDEYAGMHYIDPTLRWQDYLSSINPEMDYQSTSPFERGERPQIFSGRARWLR